MQVGVRGQKSGVRSQESEVRRVRNGVPNSEFRFSLFDFQLSQESEEPRMTGSPRC
jgi:hypothetical protein